MVKQKKLYANIKAKKKAGGIMLKGGNHQKEFKRAKKTARKK